MVLLGAKFASVMRPQKKTFPSWNTTNAICWISVKMLVIPTSLFTKKIVVGSVTAYNEHHVIICKKL
jgi:hypothetical protein